MVLSSWALDANLFEGDLTAGPVPTIFSEEVEAAREAINSGREKAHADIQRMARMFLMVESILQEEAAGIVKKPR